MEPDPPSISNPPPAAIPTAFADGVLNLAHNKNVVKFYLARLDPSLDAKGPYLSQAFAQIVMPVAGFMDTFAFFERGIAAMIADKTITKEDVEAARRGYAGYTP